MLRGKGADTAGRLASQVDAARAPITIVARAALPITMRRRARAIIARAAGGCNIPALPFWTSSSALIIVATDGHRTAGSFIVSAATTPSEAAFTSGRSDEILAGRA